MSTASLVAVPTGRLTISFELFPPRTPAGADGAWRTVQHLADCTPDFFSVTYGASGSSREASREVVHRIRTETLVPPVAHLTCVGATRGELATLVTELVDEGVRDFLALRGDPPAGQAEWRPHPEGVASSSELVRLIREVERDRLGTTGAVSIAVAAYPSGTSHTRAQDVRALLEKQQSGADFAITQVFYELESYVSLVQQAREAGVALPIVAGIIPMTDPGRLARLTELTGVPVPDWLTELLTVDDDDERHRRGIAATVELVQAVTAAGAPGVHLYTFNKHRPALDVVERLARPLPHTPATHARTL